jgi:S-adenosylmethionine:tRNA ribosyltransferase-isomerase
MNIDELQYDLKPENIACEPPEVRLGRRDLGKLLVVDRTAKRLHDSHMFEFTKWLEPGDVIIFNDSKRIPGVLKTKTLCEGAQIELRFAGLEEENVGICRAYPPHFVKENTILKTRDGRRLRVIETDIPPHNLCRIESEDEDLASSLKSAGLPITSFFSLGYWKLENYNNFYAKKEGSIESPMAGMHFTPELFSSIKNKGCEIGFITLHSVGSWLPFLEDDLKDHQMLGETYELPAETAKMIESARKRGARIIACGSTVMRTLETVGRNGSVTASEGKTDLYISPGYQFKIVNAYFTNFHISRSSLMVLDASFCDVELLKKSYQHASQAGYLFHEFGDAVFYT